MAEDLFEEPVSLNRFKRKPFRLTSNWAGEADFPARDLFVNDRFDFALGRIDRLGVAQQCEAGAKMSKLKPLVANMQIQFDIGRESSVFILGIRNHDYT